MLLLEHEHVVTLSKRTPPEHLLVDVESMGATVAATDRGGDITYHGPGQLVGYPILTVPGKRGGGMADTARYVHTVEELPRNPNGKILKRVLRQDWGDLRYV